MRKNELAAGAPPGPRWGAYSAPPDPLAGLRGPSSMGRGGERGTGGKGRGGKCPLSEILKTPLPKDTFT